MTPVPGWIEALADSPASQWVRCALQVNPYAYGVRHGVKTDFTDEASYNTALVRALDHAGVELIAVTDHFRVADSATLLAATREAGIVALPAFEASTVEGLHFLVIFDEAATLGDVERCIGKCDVKDVGTPSPHSGISALDLLDLCAELRAACIAAHVTQDNGLLKHATGQARLAIWQAANLLAVAIPGAIKDVPEKHRMILTNSDSNYARPQLPAIINAGDISSPAAVGNAGTSCRLRMSSPSQAALRHALLDAQSRVRLDSDPPRPPRPSLVAVHWDGGLLDGETIPLAEELNVLIGAPGAGKSTVLESLRAAFELKPSSPRALEDHEGILEKVLRNGTTISVVIDHPLPTPMRYIIERRLPNPASVRIADDWKVSDRSVTDLAPIPEIYGQHEIADLAADAARRTELLHRFVGHKAARETDRDSVVARLEQSRSRTDVAASAVEDLTAKLSLLPGAKERLELFEEARVDERLAEQVLLDREKRVIDDARDALAALREGVDEFVDGIPVAASQLDDRVQQSPVAAELQKVLDAVRVPLDLAGAQAQAVRDALSIAEAAVDEVFVKWKGRRADADKALQDVKSQLEAESIDAEVYRQVRQRVDQLTALKPKLDTTTAGYAKIIDARHSLLVDREELEARMLADLRKAASRVSGLLAPAVRIEVDAKVDHERVATSLRQAGGRLNEALTIFQHDAGFSPRALVETARQGQPALEARWGLPAQQAAKIAALPRPMLLELEEMPLKLSTAIQLNTAPEGDSATWTPIEQLSKGQQAIAVLLLLLLDSDAPLIVDQPEDDLDNRFISSRVVPAVREAKHRRQFVFSTHNANVPVLADAELVVGLSVRDGDQRHSEVRQEHLGAVDSRTVRALIEQRLEGGRDAFEARRRRYRLD